MKSFAQLVSCVILLSAAIGCGDGSSSSSGGTGGSGTGGSTNTGGGGAGGGPGIDLVPILMKPPALTHDCAETRAMTQEPGAMSGQIAGLAELGGAFFELRGEEKLRVTAIDLDGTLGASVDLVSEPFAFRAPALASDGETLAAVWSAPGETITFARVDATPAIVAGPTELSVTSASQSAAAALVPDGGGYALFYGALSGSNIDLSFLRLDADGNAMGAPVFIASVGETYIAEAAAAPTGDGGFALAFTTGSLGQTEVDFTIVDADGKPRFAPRRISVAASANVRSQLSASPRRSLIKVGDHYWVTFTESDTDGEKQEGSTFVRVAVVDKDGAAVLSALEAPVDQEESSWPSFEMFDDRVGLAWTKGHIIWICGGCISDHDMHFVLLDPDTLAPASQVVTHTHTINGIVAPLVARSGPDLATASSLDFHALTLPASGAIRCDPAN